MKMPDRFAPAPAFFARKTMLVHEAGIREQVRIAPATDDCPLRIDGKAQPP